MKHTCSNINTSRRSLWSLAKVAAAAAAAAALSAGIASAQTKTLYIGMNGGIMEKTWTEHIFPTFEKANNAKVVVVPGTSSDILAKAHMKTAVTVDWDVINENRPAWNARWNRIIER